MARAAWAEGTVFLCRHGVKQGMDMLREYRVKRGDSWGSGGSCQRSLREAIGNFQKVTDPRVDFKEDDTFWQKRGENGVRRR